MTLSFWFKDHDWECQIWMYPWRSGELTVVLEEILAVRCCEDDHLLSPEETEQLVAKCGGDELRKAVSSHAKRQLNPN